jgi:hypothetical protein
MLERGPSLMIPGEWVPRRPSSLPRLETGPPDMADGSVVPPALTEPGRARIGGDVEPEWPRWVQVSFLVSLMLGATLLAIWGSSIADAR